MSLNILWQDLPNDLFCVFPCMERNHFVNMIFGLSDIQSFCQIFIGFTVDANFQDSVYVVVIPQARVHCLKYMHKGVQLCQTSFFLVGPSLLAYTRGLVQNSQYIYIKDLDHNRRFLTLCCFWRCVHH